MLGVGTSIGQCAGAGGVDGLFPAGYHGLLWDANVSAYQDASAQTAASFGDPVGLLKDLSGHGADATSSGAERPVVRSDGAIAFDGSDDHLSAPLPGGGPASASIFCAVQTNDQSFLLAHAQPGGGYMICASDETGASTKSGDVGSIEEKVDGVAISSLRTELKASLSDGAWHLYEVYGADLTGWTEFRLSTYAGRPFAGSIGPRFVVIDAETAREHRDVIAAWVMAGVVT